MGTHVTLNRQAILAELGRPGGEVAAGLLQRAAKIDMAAKRLCPVDTGRLRSSITFGLARDGVGLFGKVGTDVEYAPFIEFGTSRMRAQPFLRPALAAGR